ncbi:MAG: hypothetical protein LC750_07520 [Actinobacteria bacterium]|nr:hypothetical protein [Actinomycetota bacterium]
MNGPTPRQQSYVRKLRADLGDDRYEEACRAVFGTDWHGHANIGATVTRQQMSSLISLLASTAGHTGGGGGSRNRYSSDRYARSSITRNGSGAVISYRNRAGRCEDAPCCGCCS